jgi:hypothetical protein
MPVDLAAATGFVACLQGRPGTTLPRQPGRLQQPTPAYLFFSTPPAAGRGLLALPATRKIAVLRTDLEYRTTLQPNLGSGGTLPSRGPLPSVRARWSDALTSSHLTSPSWTPRQWRRLATATTRRPTRLMQARGAEQGRAASRCVWVEGEGVGDWKGAVGQPDTRTLDHRPRATPHPYPAPHHQAAPTTNTV